MRIAMISGGRSLPSSAPVIARNSKRAATVLSTWPKFSWIVRYGLAVVSTGLSNVTVRCAEPLVSAGVRLGREGLKTAGAHLTNGLDQLIAAVVDKSP